MKYTQRKSDPAVRRTGGNRNLPVNVLDLGRMLAQQAKIASLVEQLSSLPGVARRPQRVPRPESAERIRFWNIDGIQVRDGMLHIAGWAFMPDWDPSETVAFFCIEAQCPWLARLALVTRHDVAAAFATHPEVVGHAASVNLANSGFQGIIEVSSTPWPDGDASAWIALLHRDQTAAIPLPMPGKEAQQP